MLLHVLQDFSKPFVIAKCGLMPEQTVMVPRGEVLTCGFAGSMAFAWVLHDIEAPVDMHIVVLPTGGPFQLETHEGYQPPEHVGSFFKETGHKLMPSVWHAFRWLPSVPASKVN